MSWLNAWLQLQWLTVVAAGFLFCVRLAQRRNLLALSASGELRLHYLALVGVLLVGLMPRAELPFEPEPVKKLYAAASLRDFDERTPSLGSAAFVPVRRDKAERSLPWLLLLVGGVALLGIRGPLRDQWRLRGILLGRLPWKSVGRVRVSFHEEVGAPFSCMQGRYAHVVLPLRLAADPASLRMVVRHEIEHHRRRDTHWLRVVTLLRVLTPLNPARSLWLSVLEEVQEEGCDENLVDRKRVERSAYARCLLSIATGSSGGGIRVAGAANFFPASGKDILKRRMERMYRKTKSKPFWSWALLTVGVFSLSAAALAGGNWVVDHRLSGAEAERMALVAAEGSEFPIVMNEAVLRELNRYLGTEQGRAFVKRGLENVAAQGPMVQRKLAEYQVPEELLAVGLAESGFRNLPAAQNPVRAVGIWQFIASTAEVFGLRVDDSIDERLDVEKSTDAAFRYLKANHLRFGNWLLAILAYNAGEQAVDAAIRAQGTRDPWALIRGGLKTDRDYLPRVMAMVIAMKNKRSL